MTNPYRVMCAELVDVFDNPSPPQYKADVLDRARALLGQPSSRKEQALEAIGRLCASVIHDDLKDDAAIVRRALQALDD